MDRTEGEEGGSKIGFGGLHISYIHLSVRETYIPRQISDDETTSVRCGGSKLLEPFLEYTRDDGSLVGMTVKLGDGLLRLIMGGEDKVC